LQEILERYRGDFGVAVDGDVGDEGGGAGNPNPSRPPLVITSDLAIVF
jgi:hypothetical protein